MCRPRVGEANPLFSYVELSNVPSQKKSHPTAEETRTKASKGQEKGDEKIEGREKSEARNEKRGGRKERRDRRMVKRTPCPPPLLWYSVFEANS
jgi:hypothetical protein